MLAGTLSQAFDFFTVFAEIAVSALSGRLHGAWLADGKV